LANGPYGNNGVNASFSYQYDEIGNLTVNSQLSAANYVYPASGASSALPHAVTAAGGNSYTYDNNGNMLTGAGRTYTWNQENKPLTIVQGGTTTTFVYDGDGGRVKKILGTTTTRYISKLYECDNTNCSRFIWAGSTRIATIASNGTINYWHGDHLGSSSVITDNAGTKVQAVAYYPFGNTRTNQSFTTPAIDVPYKYTGKELDSTGLYYYEARYYDPVLGRFISADIIVPDARSPQSLNRYSYVLNNPLRYIDPTGHRKCTFGVCFSKTDLRKIGGGALFAVSAVVLYYSPACGYAAPACASAGLAGMYAGQDMINGEKPRPPSIGLFCNGSGQCNIEGGGPSLYDSPRGTFVPNVVNLPALSEGESPIEGVTFSKGILGKSSVSVFVGGIWNSIEDQRSNAKRISADLLVVNSTGGYFVDLIEAVYLKLSHGGLNSSVANLANLIIQVTTDPRTAQLTLIAHSEGAAITSDALAQARDGGADLSKIAVNVYGGASWTYPAGVNITFKNNPFDPVPGLTGRGNPALGAIGAIFGFGFGTHQFEDYVRQR